MFHGAVMQELQIGCGGNIVAQHSIAHSTHDTQPNVTMRLHNATARDECVWIVCICLLCMSIMRRYTRTGGTGGGGWRLHFILCGRHRRDNCVEGFNIKVPTNSTPCVQYICCAVPIIDRVRRRNVDTERT